MMNNVSSNRYDIYVFLTFGKPLMMKQDICKDIFRMMNNVTIKRYDIYIFLTFGKPLMMKQKQL